MKNMYKITLLLLLFTNLFGCSKKETGYEGSERALSVAEQKESVSSDKAGKEDKKLIKEGNIRFESYDMATTHEAINKAVEEFSGYISQENSYTQSNQILSNIIIRVPAGSFDALVARITGQAGRLDSKHIELKDVSEEYYDIELRIRIKKETEKRYREILEKARTVDEILSIEKQIGSIRAEIESLEGRFKYLNNKISYGTLTVDYYQKVSSAIGFLSKFRQGITNGWNNFVWFLVAVVNVWPFILIIVSSTSIIVIRRKRRPTPPKANET